jgi:hypothetical protein
MQYTLYHFSDGNIDAVVISNLSRSRVVEQHGEPKREFVIDGNACLLPLDWLLVPAASHVSLRP